MASVAPRSSAVTGRAVGAAAHDDAREPRAQVGLRGRQRQDRHDLAGGRDVEAGGPLGLAAGVDDDLAQGAVVHVDDALPGGGGGRQAAGAAEVQVGVDHRGEQVVGAGDRVQVAGEVEVDVVGRLHLGLAAAGAAALDAEHGAERGLAQAQRHAGADAPQPLGEADADGGLALAGGRGGDGGHEHQAAAGRGGVAIDRVDLGLAAAEGGEALGVEAEVGGHLEDGAQVGGKMILRSGAWPATSRRRPGPSRTSAA
jgi:hypothetical protein